MDGRRARLVTPPLDSVPAIPEAAPPRAPATGDRLKLGWSLVLGLGWPVVFAIASALEPTPADPQASPPVIVQLASLVFLGALVGAAVAGASRHRAAAVAGVVAGVVGVTMSVTCPLSGHHDFGLWWPAQLGLMTIMLLTSVAALGRRARATT